MNNINDLMENARLKGRVIALEAQLESERAEVERLNTGIQPEGNNDAVGRAVNLLLEKEKEIARLKAEVERLTSENALVREESDRHYGLWVERGYQLAKLRKAGTEMGKHLPDTDAANRAYIDFEAEAGE